MPTTHKTLPSRIKTTRLKL